MVEMHEMVSGSGSIATTSSVSTLLASGWVYTLWCLNNLYGKEVECASCIWSPGKIPKEVQGCKKIKLPYFIMIFASIHFVLSQLPNFNSICGISLSAAI
ncbi:Lysine histidine transporter 1 [Platanthera guangdongensis]|uniref:Lysine histidine transporter 1 n=1 Tax=Platanthera guangdongensis TaxID=2320717 RepID=A0ABR2N2F1_9ASPA